MSSRKNQKSPRSSSSTPNRHPPAFLPVGTRVTTRVRGAYCSARVKSVSLLLIIKVKFINPTLGMIELKDDDIVGSSYDVGSTVKARHPVSGAIHSAMILSVEDHSIYEIQFDDDDRMETDRSKLRLPGESHYKKSETLNYFPLFNPTTFDVPVELASGPRRTKGQPSATVTSADVREEEIHDEALPHGSVVENGHEEQGEAEAGPSEAAGFTGLDESASTSRGSVEGAPPSMKLLAKKTGMTSAHLQSLLATPSARHGKVPPPPPLTPAPSLRGPTELRLFPGASGSVLRSEGGKASKFPFMITPPKLNFGGSTLGKGVTGSCSPTPGPSASAPKESKKSKASKESPKRAQKPKEKGNDGRKKGKAVKASSSKEFFTPPEASWRQPKRQLSKEEDMGEVMLHRGVEGPPKVRDMNSWHNYPRVKKEKQRPVGPGARCNLEVGGVGGIEGELDVPLEMRDQDASTLPPKKRKQVYLSLAEAAGPANPIPPPPPPPSPRQRRAGEEDDKHGDDGDDDDDDDDEDEAPAERIQIREPKASTSQGLNEEGRRRRPPSPQELMNGEHDEREGSVSKEQTELLRRQAEAVQDYYLQKELARAMKLRSGRRTQTERLNDEERRRLYETSTTPIGVDHTSSFEEKYAELSRIVNVKKLPIPDVRNEPPPVLKHYNFIPNLEGVEDILERDRLLVDAIKRTVDQYFVICNDLTAEEERERAREMERENRRRGDQQRRVEVKVEEEGNEHDRDDGDNGNDDHVGEHEDEGDNNKDTGDEGDGVEVQVNCDSIKKEESGEDQE